MSLKIDVFVTAPLETNTYVLRTGAPNTMHRVGDPAEDDCWVVDPGMGLGKLIGSLRRGNLTPSRILLTHGHGDHIAGVGELRSAFPAARVCCPAGDEEMLTDARKNVSADFGFDIVVGPADELLRPGQTLAMGALQWSLLDTSGHSPGSLSYYCAVAGVVLCGDALFAGSIGRTDFPGASQVKLLANIRAHLLALPDETRVLPGHGPQTTIGVEKRSNPFLVGS